MQNFAAMVMRRSVSKGNRIGSLWRSGASPLHFRIERARQNPGVDAGVRNNPGGTQRKRLWTLARDFGQEMSGGGRDPSRGKLAIQGRSWST